MGYLKQSAAIAGAGVVLLLLIAAEVCSGASRLPLRSSTCTQIECPAYEVLEEGDEFSVRLYNNTVWMATSAIQDDSFVSGTRTGFLKLFQYIQGANEESASVNMTAPVVTGIIPSEGPFCESSFVVRFYVPEAFQDDPPTPNADLDLAVDRWGARFFAVKQFSGFATDATVVQQAASLASAVSDAGYSVASDDDDDDESYLVAQYDSPFQITSRLNEIWLPLSNFTLRSS